MNCHLLGAYNSKKAELPNNKENLEIPKRSLICELTDLTEETLKTVIANSPPHGLDALDWIETNSLHGDSPDCSDH
jgi:hypothetical protein